MNFVVTLSARDNKNHQNFLENDLKDYFLGMNIKQKELIKIRQKNLDNIWNHLLKSIDYLF